MDGERRDLINRLAYDIPSAAVFLSISERQLREMVERRRIASVKVGRLVRFRQTDLDAFVEGCVRPVRPQHQVRLPFEGTPRVGTS